MDDSLLPSSDAGRLPVGFKACSSMNFSRMSLVTGLAMLLHTAVKKLYIESEGYDGSRYYIHSVRDLGPIACIA